MESNKSPDGLRALERAEAAPFIDYRPSPWWWPPAFALWVAVLAALPDWSSEMIGNRSPLSTFIMIGILTGLVAALGAWSKWYPRHYGSMPRMWRPKPAEIRRAWLAWLVAYVAAVAAVIAIARAQPWWVTGLAAFVIAYLLMAWFERYYDRAAKMTRERLG